MAKFLEVRGTGVHGAAEIHGDDARTALKRNIRKPAGTTPTVKHCCALHLRRRPARFRRKAIGRFRGSRKPIDLCAPEGIPLRAETRRVSLIRHAAQDAATNRQRAGAGRADEPTLRRRL